MPLLSFSGKTSEGPFWKQILERRKIQTCRKPRKRPIKQGDSLFLYWKVRTPRAQKEIHYIGKATCVKIERKKYPDVPKIAHEYVLVVQKPFSFSG